MWNIYKVTFERENGTIGSDTFYVPTEVAARKAFNECYRNGNVKIINIEIV